MNSADPCPTRADDRELVVVRTMNAPRERVFAAWTTRLADWWGPHGMTTRVVELDLRAGGTFRTIMRAPDGTEHPTRGVFLEVTAPERIVFTDGFAPGWRPHPDIFFTAVVTFEALPGERTLFTARARHWTAAARAHHERMGFHQGWGESVDRLASFVTHGWCPE